MHLLDHTTSPQHLITSHHNTYFARFHGSGEVLFDTERFDDLAHAIGAVIKENHSLIVTDQTCTTTTTTTSHHIIITLHQITSARL
jgi:hypothetical protein